MISRLRVKSEGLKKKSIDHIHFFNVIIVYIFILSILISYTGRRSYKKLFSDYITVLFEQESPK